MTSSPRLHVVVTCANRKTRPVPASLRLGDLARPSPAAWIARLESEPAPVLPARDLYAGEHWEVVRSIADQGATVWVCSAGYGLIPPDAPLLPYAATFTPGHADAVPGDAAAWWQALAAWPGPAPAMPRTLAELVRRQPGARVLVAVSPPYLAALGADLAEAAAVAGDGAVSVVSAGSRSLGGLQGLLLPADARLQAALGGTRQALNARIVACLVGTGLVAHDDMRAHLHELLRRQPPVPVFDRRRMTDTEVRGFIRGHLAGDPSATHSRLLRALRDSGLACEQRRFAALFAAEAVGR